MCCKKRRGQDIRAVVRHYSGEHMRRRTTKPSTVSRRALAAGNVITATDAEHGNLDLGERA